jgi:hypothetical protein
MPAVYTLEWKDGRKQDLWGGGGYFYVFPDRTLRSFHPYDAWCHSCGQIRLCEHFKDEASIREEIAALSDPASALSRRVATMRERSPGDLSSEAVRAAFKGPLETELRHLLRRKLAPSCLHCGQRRVSYFKKGDWAPHPGTGEEVRLYFSGIGIPTSHYLAWKFYDIEGNFLDLSDEEKQNLLESDHNAI